MSLVGTQLFLRMKLEKAHRDVRRGRGKTEGEGQNNPQISRTFQTVPG